MSPRIHSGPAGTSSPMKPLTHWGSAPSVSICSTYCSGFSSNARPPMSKVMVGMCGSFLHSTMAGPASRPANALSHSCPTASAIWSTVWLPASANLMYCTAASQKLQRAPWPTPAACAPALTICAHAGVVAARCAVLGAVAVAVLITWRPWRALRRLRATVSMSAARCATSASSEHRPSDAQISSSGMSWMAWMICGRYCFTSDLHCMAMADDAPMALLMDATSSVGPAMSDVPVSPMAAQPRAHSLVDPMLIPSMLNCQ
mmetsp:Transcript_11617/g.28477  ORF Transcript_11617/g.28477 Transcript_11617/m.28477 type:complete len:260 (+) Transcript_11617:77-856(+)